LSPLLHPATARSTPAIYVQNGDGVQNAKPLQLLYEEKRLILSFYIKLIVSFSSLDGAGKYWWGAGGVFQM